MSTTKQALKIRLDPEQLHKLNELHGGYGEKSRVITELVTAYLRSRGIRRNGAEWTEAEAIGNAVSGRQG